MKMNYGEDPRKFLTTQSTGRALLFNQSLGRSFPNSMPKLPLEPQCKSMSTGSKSRQHVKMFKLGP